MPKIKKLGDVKVDILPPKVVMLLAKYSHRLKKCSDITIKLSSKTILKELDDANRALNDEVLQSLYEEILAEFVSTSNTKMREASNSPSFLQSPLGKKIRKEKLKNLR